MRAARGSVAGPAAVLALVAVSAAVVAQVVVTAGYAVRSLRSPPAARVRSSLIADEGLIPSGLPVAFAGGAQIQAVYYLYPHMVTPAPRFSSPAAMRAWMAGRHLRYLIVQRAPWSRLLRAPMFVVVLQEPSTRLLALPP